VDLGRVFLNRADGHRLVNIRLSSQTLSKPKLLRAMFDVGYFPPNTPRNRSIDGCVVYPKELGVTAPPSRARISPSPAQIPGFYFQREARAKENEHDGQSGTGNLSCRPARVCGLRLSGDADFEKHALCRPCEALNCAGKFVRASIAAGPRAVHKPRCPLLPRRRKQRIAALRPLEMRCLGCLMSTFRGQGRS